jgi:serine protease Do
VIGINTAIFSPNGGSVGIGFAIPSNSAVEVLDQLRKGGHVDRGWLGVQIQEVTPEIAASLGLDDKHPAGALVAAVTADSPAAKAGMKVQDVIDKFDGKTIEKPRDLQRIVAETGIGKVVPVDVIRGGQHVALQATTAEMDEKKLAAAMGGGMENPAEKPTNKASALGLSLSELNADMRQRLNIPKEINGVLVSRVKDGSPAADHGVEAGDVIVQVNGLPVDKPEDVIAQANSLKSGEKKAILLLINRHGNNRFLAIEPKSKDE